MEDCISQSIFYYYYFEIKYFKNLCFLKNFEKKFPKYDNENLLTLSHILAPFEYKKLTEFIYHE